MSLDSQLPKGSLQHGYHRLTGFSGRSCSPTNPVRWCDSSSLATPYSGGTMGAGRWRQCEFMAAAEIKPYNRASPAENRQNSLCSLEKHTTALAGEGNAPLLVLTHHLSPGGGELSASLCYELLKLAQGETESRPPPSGGGAVGRRGAFSRAKRGCLVFAATGSAAAKGGIYTAAKRPPQPSGLKPVKPKNPPANGRSNFRTFREAAPAAPPPSSSQI